MPDFYKADFLTFCKKSGTGGRPTIPDFLAFQIQISRFPDFLPDFLCIPMCSREFKPLYDGQARQVGCVGRSGGVPYYRNDILINVVEEYLPQGL